MIQETLLRLKGLELGSPIISCGEGHRFMVAQQIGEVSDTKPTIILEPMAKNTAKKQGSYKKQTAANQKAPEQKKSFWQKVKSFFGR